jgi:DNA-binding transcriptional LysR family regulator
VRYPSTPATISALRAYRPFVSYTLPKNAGIGTCCSRVPSANRISSPSANAKSRLMGSTPGSGTTSIIKSEVDVAEDLAAGRLERVLPDWDGGDAPVVALYPSARYLPLKTRVLLDELAAQIAAIMTRTMPRFPAR